MRGFGTIYRQKNSRFLWMQYWRNGKAHRESTKCVKVMEAREILKKRLRDLAAEALEHASSDPARKAVTVAELFAGLERDYVINERKSLVDLRIRWHKHLEPRFATFPASSLTADEIGVYVARRLAEGASNATVNRELATLKRMYNLAIRSGRLKLGEAPYISMLAERNVRKGFVRDEQYSDLARETGRIGLWLRALFELGFTYGWRKAELLGLKVSQVDMLERTIRLEPGTTKNEEGRLVEMTAKVYELLSSLVSGKGPDEKVFTRGKKAVRCFRTAWKRATDRAGCPGLLFHDLRRSGVRNLVRAGVTEKVAMTISGHRTRSIFERYNIVSQNDIHQAVNLLEKAAERRNAAMFEKQQDLMETRKPS